MQKTITAETHKTIRIEAMLNIVDLAGSEKEYPEISRQHDFLSPRYGFFLMRFIGGEMDILNVKKARILIKAC